MNPPIVIQDIRVRGIIVHVIRDDSLVAGTKQRALYPMLTSRKDNEFIYAGPTTGAGQLAVAYCAKLLGKSAVLFLQGPPALSELSRAYGAKIYLRDKLCECQQAAQEYAKSRKSARLLPFGLECDEFTTLLEQQLRICTREIQPRRIWIVVGSGTLLRVLARIFAATIFLAVQVGKKIWEDQFEPQVWARIRIFVAPQKFFDGIPAALAPPYPSCVTYDAKIWQFVLQFAQNDDYIWNVL